ncbi:tripeptidyl-peptidase [Rhypophila decipiens]|uniref:tripeptidyl-peptidase II n=1 Tax=Rhypophila decipiens TaxID=261697 RepID=A0AAN6Y8N8_9PEZI|nr:tripeptidyl-peptidase [Rhypophila decipiens]
MWFRSPVRTGLPVLWVLLSLVSIAAAAPTVILEQVQNKQLPEGWKFHKNASASDLIKISIALRESRITDLKDHLSRQWKSGSSDYQHLTLEEVRQYRQPNEAVIDTVTGWLKSNGIRHPKVHGSMLSFEASVQTIKSLFDADLAYYSFDSATLPNIEAGSKSEQLSRRQIPTSKPVLRALSYSVPTWLRRDIAFVHPLTNFMTPRSHHVNQHANQIEIIQNRRRDVSKRSTVTISSTSAPPPPTDDQPPAPWPYVPDSPLNSTNPFDYESGTDMPCFTGTFPECIRNLYNMNYTTSLIAAASVPPLLSSPVRYGIAGFLEQWIMHADVSAFLQAYSPEISPLYNFSVHTFNGGINPQDNMYNAGMEASLDVEYAVALGYPANVTYYITGGRGTKLDWNGTALSEEESDNEPYLEFLEGLVALPDDEIPHVLSISYADDEKSVPRAYAERVCDLFAALAARGTSVLAATGDGGAAGTAQTQCITNDGNNLKKFVPTFPASCPWVTAVGATDNYGPPVRAADFSTGGLSDFFARPEWQFEAVNPVVDDLVKNGDERLEWVNITGRAIPDISAVGAGYQIRYGGRIIEVLGTSASTPVVAAMIALVNDKRLREGKSSLGWLNPRIYSGEVRDVLKDIVHGESYGCSFPGGPRSRGWEAREGYDLVTGLGTVKDFGDFLEVMAK